MITVGIRNLRNSLSKYINIAKAGERILITDHDRIVAELVPSEQADENSSLLAKYMEEQIINGSVIKSTKRTILEKSRNKDEPETNITSGIYNETRDERI